MKSIKIIKSRYFEHESTILEMDIAPHTGNPKHYHTLFDETFEVLEGELFVGKGKETKILLKGEKITIPIGTIHHFKNQKDYICRIRVTLNPGNSDFEDAMVIYYGLKRDGLLTSAGTPKHISDLAIFLKLNNSKMKGFSKVVEYIFNLIANNAIKKGRLEQLRNRYTI
jgi:quercetin dioxygenase-like cupin family protein